MNVKSNSGQPFKLDVKKIAVIVLILGIAGYQWYTQNKSDNPKLAVENGQVDGTTATLPHDYSVDFQTDSKSSNGAQSKNGNATSKPATKRNESFLKPARGQNLKSPAGLI